MNEVTLKSDAVTNPIDGGLEVTVTGIGRTLIAIQRMIPAYSQTVNGLNGWTAKTETLPNGEAGCSGMTVNVRTMPLPPSWKRKLAKP